MNSALTIQKYLALNQGRYFRETLKIPRLKSNIYITTHPETAATDLPHYHETAHLSFVLSGGVIDKRRHGETEKKIGELMFFHAEEIHQSLYRGFPVKNINIELESEFFYQNDISESKFGTIVNKNSNAKFTLLKIYKEMSAHDEFSESSIEMLLLNLLDGKDLHERSHPLWLNKLIEILNDNWNEEISVSDLANAVSVHPKTISKFFPRYFNCTLGEYRRRLKIEKSLSLVKSSKKSLTEIAHQCGFYDQSHFTSNFKKLTGFRPKQFQQL